MRKATIDYSNVIDLYINKCLSGIEIAKLKKCESTAIYRYLLKKEIKIKHNRCHSAITTYEAKTKYSFLSLNKETAFILGVIFGDGHVDKHHISITSGDVDLLNNINHIYNDKLLITENKIKNSFCLVLSNSILCEQLINEYKIASNKSNNIIFPKIENSLLPSFLSGYLASDGCIFIKQKGQKHMDYCLSFSSCSLNFLEQINETLISFNLPKGTICLMKKSKEHYGRLPVYQLRYYTKKALAISNFIFSDNDSLLRLERKYLKHKQFKDFTTNSI